MQAKRCAVDKYGSSRFAFLMRTPSNTQKQQIVVYDATSAVPVKVQGSSSAVIALSFLPSLSGQSKGDLVYFDEHLAFNLVPIDQDSSTLVANQDQV